MSLARMVYVRCDRCGNPADLGDDAAEARAIAKRAGWTRTHEGDLCNVCTCHVQRRHHPVVDRVCQRCGATQPGDDIT